MSVMIVLEGKDGAGKTTLANALENNLGRSGYQTERFRFPSYEGFGKQHRDSFSLDSEEDRDPYTCMMRNMLDRKEHLKDILTDIDKGKVVIVDRWFLSGAVYEMAHILNDFDYSFAAIAESEEFLTWAIHTEFEKLNMPRSPTFILDANEHINTAGKTGAYDQNANFQEAVGHAYNIAFTKFLEEDWNVPIMNLSVADRDGWFPVNDTVDEICDLVELNNKYFE